MSTMPTIPTPKALVTQRAVEKYDGQLVWINKQPEYELGNYLGGGQLVWFMKRFVDNMQKNTSQLKF